MNTAIVTVTYGSRWKFLERVVDSVIDDVNLHTIIIVDNASKDRADIEAFASKYPSKVRLIRNEHNLGSAGGFNQGICEARKLDCKYVLLLDDDNCPEKGAIANFIETMKFFPNGKAVLLGNRLNIPTNDDFFYKQTIRDDSPRGTFFQVFNFLKVLHFLDMFFFLRTKSVKSYPFVPVAPTEAFVYGGAFIPIDAIQRAELPDIDLVLYGDDVEYSWNIKNLGYSSYLCSSPLIYDLDLTFGEGSHIFGLFAHETKSFKIYYRIRNMVRLSAKHSKQFKIVLLFNIIAWVAGLLTLGLLNIGPTRLFYKRAKLIITAVAAGYFQDIKTPKEAILP